MRALLVAVLFFGVFTGFAARIYHRGERQRQVLIAARAAGAHIEYDFEHYKESRWHAPARWLAPWIGADQAGNVYELSFPGTEIDHWRPIVASAAELQSITCFQACSQDLNTQDLQQLAKFKQLKELGFQHVAELPDLQPLANFAHLEDLRINCRGVTVEKLAPLRDAPKLRILGLAYTDATDEIIPLLVTFPKLEELYVTDSDIHAAGLAGLKDSKSLKILHVDPTQQEAKDLLPGVKVIVE